MLDRQGQPQRVAVYLECSCRTLIEASIDLTDTSGFTDVMDTVPALPIPAKKITQQTETANA